MLVVGLVLASAFLHALWNALLKRWPDKDVAGVSVVVVSAAVSVLVAAGQVAVTGAHPFPRAPGLAWAAAAGVFEGGYFISLVLAMERAPLGIAYTVSRGGSLVAVWPISVLALGERVTTLAVAGTAVLCAGLAASGLDARGSRARQGGLAWAGAAALCIAGYHLCYKRSLAAGAAEAALFGVSMLVAIPSNLARLEPARRRAAWLRLRRLPPALLGIGVVCAASFLVFLVALRRGGAGYVLTLRNTSVVFAVPLGWALGERPTRAAILGAVLVAGGAVLLKLGS